MVRQTIQVVSTFWKTSQTKYGEQKTERLVVVQRVFSAKCVLFLCMFSLASKILICSGVLCNQVSSANLALLDFGFAMNLSTGLSTRLHMKFDQQCWLATRWGT